MRRRVVHRGEEEKERKDGVFEGGGQGKDMEERRRHGWAKEAVEDKTTDAMDQTDSL